jgi:transposase
MSTQEALALPPSAPSAAVVINGRATLRAEGEQRVVVVAGLPVHHYGAGDPVAEAYAMVFLVDAGFAQQNEVARAFGCSVRTVRRHQRRYAEGGMAALAARSGWRPGRRRVAGKRLRVVERLKAHGMSNREIARRVGVTENAIRKLVGPSPDGQHAILPLAQIAAAARSTATAVSSVTTPSTAPCAPRPADADATSGGTGAGRDGDGTDDEPVPMSLDVDAADRSFDRLLACFGLLDDAAPVFAPARSVAGAGVLVAIPALVGSGIFGLARKLYGTIGPAFYGLRTTVLVLLVMALRRIKRPEHLKERDPAVLGRLLGLDRAPEVKTLRRKLTRLAAYHRGEQLGAELARRRVEMRGHVMGFLYVDGHVRAYHGQRTLPKAFVTTRRLAMPATTDYWVGDSVGDPLLVVTAPANAGLTKMLPAVLARVRETVGERRVTVVFDRGGYSPKLFAEILDHGFDIVTYRKGKSRRVAERRFRTRRAKLDGRWVSYDLHDQPVRLLKGTLRLRQVTRRTEDGHQTQVLTSRWDLRDIEVAYRMFERWRQENFFKYMREEFLLDALIDYQVEPDDPTRTVPNPERRRVDTQIRAVRAEVATLEQRFGAAAADNPEGQRPTMRGFKIAHGKLGKQLRSAKGRLAKLIDQRRDLPRRVQVQDTSHAAVIRLATERKHLSNLIKMVAYQAESDLAALLGPHYARADDEGRTLVHELLQAAADLDVTDSELRVTLRPLSSPHRTLAIKALCENLNETATTFPGSRLRLRFAIAAPPVRGLAFPGPRPLTEDSPSASTRPKPDTSAPG